MRGNEMKSEVKTPVVIVAVVVLVLVLGLMGMKFIGSVGNLDQGQVSYTPGVPPWMQKDPTKRGPAGLGNHTQPTDASGQTGTP